MGRKGPTKHRNKGSPPKVEEHTSYYTVLGVEETASATELRSAYFKLSRTLHPDRPGGSKEGFQQLTEAFNVLSDTRKRMAYDLLGHESVALLEELDSVKKLLRPQLLKWVPVLYILCMVIDLVSPVDIEWLVMLAISVVLSPVILPKIVIWLAILATLYILIPYHATAVLCNAVFYAMLIIAVNITSTDFCRYLDVSVLVWISMLVVDYYRAIPVYFGVLATHGLMTGVTVLVLFAVYSELLGAWTHTYKETYLAKGLAVATRIPTPAWIAMSMLVVRLLSTQVHFPLEYLGHALAMVYGVATLPNVLSMSTAIPVVIVLLLWTALLQWDTLALTLGCILNGASILLVFAVLYTHTAESNPSPRGYIAAAVCTVAVDAYLNMNLLSTLGGLSKLMLSHALVFSVAMALALAADMALEAEGSAPEEKHESTPPSEDDMPDLADDEIYQRQFQPKSTSVAEENDRLRKEMTALQETMKREAEESSRRELELHLQLEILKQQQAHKQ